MSAVEGLTSLAKAGGCAAKYSAARLEELLSAIVPAEAHDLLVGLDPADDAAVYRLDDQTAIVVDEGVVERVDVHQTGECDGDAGQQPVKPRTPQGTVSQSRR